ncbi:hypothetical protein AVEN_172349-1 [Araneus ventricosus]|uniref:Uncharacterized protein n=1 Tax=Araneus ventricosus TaxID=182803 RepID=A0A4Y2E2W2_ARAVE|nr:hypothetical protein AVEN_172349-1 [Araneus ventricosus]
MHVKFYKTFNEVLSGGLGSGPSHAVGTAYPHWSFSGPTPFGVGWSIVGIHILGLASQFDVWVSQDLSEKNAKGLLFFKWCGNDSFLKDWHGKWSRMSVKDRIRNSISYRKPQRNKSEKFMLL